MCVLKDLWNEKRDGAIYWAHSFHQLQTLCRCFQDLWSDARRRKMKSEIGCQCNFHSVGFALPSISCGYYALITCLKRKHFQTQRSDQKCFVWLSWCFDSACLLTWHIAHELLKHFSQVFRPALKTLYSFQRGFTLLSGAFLHLQWVCPSGSGFKTLPPQNSLLVWQSDLL